MKFRYDYQTDIGNIRSINQDDVALVEKSGQIKLALLCDGLGGHKKGDIASAMAIKLFSELFEAADFSLITTDQKIREWLNLQILYIQKKMREYSAANSDASDMGTTLVALLFANNKVYGVNIGDSRIYRYYDSKFEQLTTDHNIINYYLKHKNCHPYDINIDKTFWKALTSALGTERKLTIDYFMWDLVTPCYFLLTSDGFHDFVLCDEIITILNSKKKLKKKVKMLIDAALENYSTDNITVLLIYIT